MALTNTLIPPGKYVVEIINDRQFRIIDGPYKDCIIASRLASYFSPCEVYRAKIDQQKVEDDPSQ
jgi:hypothetical protein